MYGHILEWSQQYLNWFEAISQIYLTKYLILDQIFCKCLKLLTMCIAPGYWGHPTPNFLNITRASLLYSSPTPSTSPFKENYFHVEFSRNVLVNSINSTIFHPYAFFPEVIVFFDRPLKLLKLMHQDHGWKRSVWSCPVCQRMGPRDMEAERTMSSRFSNVKRFSCS